MNGVALSRHISWLYAVIALVEQFLFSLSIEDFLLFSRKSSNEKMSSRIASHFRDREVFPEWADRTWSGQERPVDE